MEKAACAKKIFEEIESVLEKNGLGKAGGFLMLETDIGLVSIGSKFNRIGAAEFAAITTSVLKQSFGDEFAFDTLGEFELIRAQLEEQILSEIPPGHLH